MALFDWDTMPEEGRKEFQKQVLKMVDEPARLCCGKRHFGPVCPDGMVMCCLCFDRFEVSNLNVSEDGTPENVCKECAEMEANAGLAEDLQKAQQDLNAATNRIAKFVSYWQSFCECECVSETPQGSCMYCDLQQLKASDI